MIDAATWEKLVEAAKQAQARAYAPYSDFHVGAALLTKDGQIVGGCNVENATYGATCCAERTAIYAAVAQGLREFVGMAVVTDAPEAATSCGICRQVLAEFNYEMELLFRSTQGPEQRFVLKELLPAAFVLK